MAPTGSSTPAAGAAQGAPWPRSYSSCDKIRTAACCMLTAGRAQAGPISVRHSQRSGALRARVAAQSRPADNAVEAEDVCVKLGDRQVLKGAGLSVPRGTFHLLLGPNGCGKSTLLRVLGGLLAADSGATRVAGPVGFVFQNPDHQIVMPTVGADVAFGLGGLGLSEAEAQERVKSALATVGLAGFHERPTHDLSGGEKQRVAIAGALAQRPQVLLLDELTTFLDAGDQRSVLSAIRASVAADARVTALWVTHRLEELEYADGASFMDAGAVRLSGSPREVGAYLREQGASW